MLFNDSRSLILAKEQATSAAPAAAPAAAASAETVAVVANQSTIAASTAATPTADVVTAAAAAGDAAATSVDASASASKADADAEQEETPELDIVINNVVCSFSVRCHLNLREIALNGSNVEYRRENGMVTMRLRRPYTTASVWSSGRITITGATSETLAKVAARRFARCLSKLGFPVHFQKFRIFNVLGTCSMPWAIKIFNFSERHRVNANYEPELHPGVTYRMRDLKATLKIFSTGSITVTAATVDAVDSAIQRIYPLVYEFRNKNSIKDVVNQLDENHMAKGMKALRPNTGGTHSGLRLNPVQHKMMPLHVNWRNLGNFASNTQGMVTSSYPLNATGFIPNVIMRNNTSFNSSMVAQSNTGLCNTTGLSNTGLSNTGLSNTGLSTTGLRTIALSSSSLNTTGLNPNGLSSTGLNPNVLMTNGLSTTGLNPNVLRTNGLSTNGLNGNGSTMPGQSYTILKPNALNTNGLNFNVLISTAVNSNPYSYNGLNFRSGGIASEGIGSNVSCSNANSSVISTSTNSTSSSSGRTESIHSNARRRATECWVTKMKNKRARYNDFTGISDVTALARAANAHAANAYANANAGASAGPGVTGLAKPSQPQVVPKNPSSDGGQQVLTSKFFPRDPIEGMEDVDDVDWQFKQ